MEWAVFHAWASLPLSHFPARQSGTATPKGVFDWQHKRPVWDLGEPQQAFRNIQKDIPETLLVYVIGTVPITLSMTKLSGTEPGLILIPD